MLPVPNYYLTVNSVDDTSAATLNEFSFSQILVLGKAPKNSFKIFILKCMVRSIQNSAKFSANQRPSLLEIGVSRYALMQWTDAYIYIVLFHASLICKSQYLGARSSSPSYLRPAALRDEYPWMKIQVNCLCLVHENGKRDGKDCQYPLLYEYEGYL